MNLVGMDKLNRKHKRGDVRADGRVFWAYANRRGRVDEIWLTRESVLKSKESSSRWKRNNPDKHRAHSRKSVNRWREAHPDRARMTRDAYVAKNLDKLREKGRQKRQIIKEKGGVLYENFLQRFRDLNRAWVKANPDKQAARAARRRARMQSSIVTLTKAELGIARTLYKTCRRISSCTGIMHHVDHITPLAKGGLHCPQNFQILPAAINLRKGTKTTTPH